MSRHFSVPKMLRMTPNPLLREFFERQQITLLSLDWKRLGKRHVEPLILAMSWLPATDQERVESALAMIYELACDRAWEMVLTIARQIGHARRLIEQFGDASPYVRAMRIWLDEPELFQTASMWHQVDGLTRWRKRTGLPLVEPRITQESCRELGRALSACLQREEGRGRFCTVDYLRRQDGADVFVAYSDDFVHSRLEHDSRGRLIPRSARPTFEIVFAYQAENGTLELFARVSPHLKPLLECVFGQIILGIDLSAHARRKTWDLNRLKDRYFCLETDPADGILVSISRLRLEVPEFGRFTVEPTRTGQGADVFHVIDQCLNNERVRWEEVDISLATFRFHFQSQPGRKPGLLTFDVSAPDHCSIKSKRPDRIAVAHKYLRRWRIADV
jgi:hypothetical protein